MVRIMTFETSYRQSTFVFLSISLWIVSTSQKCLLLVKVIAWVSLPTFMWN